MTPEEVIITHAMSCSRKRRLRVTINGAQINVTGDNRQPGNLRDEAAEGGGIYFTDGSTWEALVGYDSMNELKRIVVYRLPRALARCSRPPFCAGEDLIETG